MCQKHPEGGVLQIGGLGPPDADSPHFWVSRTTPPPKPDFSLNNNTSKFIGKSRAHISNCLRLLTLPQEIIELIIEEKLSQGHAKILVGLDNAILLAKKIISKKLSVRQAESLVRMLKSSSNGSTKKKDPNIVNLEEELTNKIGMRVFVRNKKNNSGTISLEYKGADQLDRLVEIIKQNY